MRLLAILMAGILAATPATHAATVGGPQNPGVIVIVTTATPTSAPMILESTTTALEPFVITAQRYPEEEIRALKQARGVSVGAAAAGTGLMAYSVFFAAGGPIGWAAGLIWLGATGIYLSTRRLKGHDDFSPTAAKPQG